MKKLISLFTLLLCISVNSFAQVITIPAANTNTNSSRLPYATYWGYERSANLYTAAEVTQFGTIYKVAFFVNSVSSPSANSGVIIKMNMTAATTIATATYATVSSGATTVFTGNITAAQLVAGTWITVTLDAPFVYSANNLLVLVETSTGGTGSGEGSAAKQFRRSNPGATRFEAWEQDNTPPTGNGTTSASRNNIQLDFTAPNPCSIGITNLNPTGTISSNCVAYTIAPSVKIKNLGTSSQTGITVRYQVPSESYDETVGASNLINTGDETTVNFPNTLNVNTSGSKAVTITVNSTCSGAQVYSLNTSYTVSNPNFGGPTGGYYFANSTSGASCSPNQPPFFWADTTGSTYLTVDNATITPLTTGTLDDGAWVITPPFAGGDGVYYDGVCYTQFAIGTNGIIGMGSSTTGVTAFTTTDIPNATAAKPAIFPMWYDQDWSSAQTVLKKSLGYKVSGQKLIITYTHAPTYHGSGLQDANDYVTYQVILEINIGCMPINSNILFQYDNSQSGSTFMTKYNNGATPPVLADHTVGIQNTLGTIATQYRRSVSGVLSNAGPLFGSPMSVAFGPNNSALPVELASFTSTANGRDVTLNWTTAKETNNSGFDVERSVNGTWSKVGNVAGNGTTTSSTNYTFTDRNLASGKYNYRLKQIDFNGNFEYFNLSNEVNVGIPEKYNLAQNYPNPFNPSTTISYDLPFDSKVSIKLFDMSGREVSSLVNEVKTAGYYSVNFNASNLSSGVYFYRISAEGNGQNFVSTKKMMLVK